MATGNDKNQSPIIAHRLPEFVQTDHPTMVAFVQAYYEWLDQQADQGYVRTPAALDGLADVDKTIEEFVAAFKKEYLLGFPEEFAVNAEGNSVDARQLIKNIKEFYRNKGTEKTYEFLFRVLYDAAVEFYYPSRDILRLSDGKWIQKYSIRCSNDLGSKIFEARGKTVVQRSTDGLVIASGRVIDVSTYQIGSRQVAELYLTNINGRFQANTGILNNYAGIEFEDNSGVLRQETRIYPVVSTVSVSSQGSNYRKGDRIFFQPSITPYQQNLLAWSEDFSQSYWSKEGLGSGNNASLQLDSSVSNPFGLNYGVFKYTASSVSNYVNRGVGVKGTTYTFSLYVKSIDATSINLICGGVGNNFGYRFNLSTGSITSIAGGSGQVASNGTRTRLSNGWNRLSITYNVTDTGLNAGPTPLFQPVSGSGTSLLVFGAQVNEGSSATPYLRTLGIAPLSIAATNDPGQGAIATIIDVDGNGGILKTRIDNFGIGYEISPLTTFDSAFGSGGAVSTTLGTLCTYPGYYSNNDGRLSTNKVMQDNHYYQNFSYVLLTEVVIDRYKDILRRLIHPAGMGMFGKVVVNRCAAETIATDTVAKRTDLNAIGNYAPYTLYTYRDMGSLFFNGRSLPYMPSIDDATITGAGGNPTGLTGLTSAHYQVAFTPKGILGLTIWLDGKTLTGAVGATVGAWADSSGNGFTASASLQNRYPTVSDMGGLLLTGSSGTFGSVLTTPSLTAALNQRSLFVAFTPRPLPDTDVATSQQNALVAGLLLPGGSGSTSSATGHHFQHHTICVDYSRNIVDGSTINPRIAAYYGLGNHAGLNSFYVSDKNGTNYTYLTHNTPTAGRFLRVNNSSSVVYSPFTETLSSITAGNPNTSIVSSILAESDPSLTAAAYSYLTEVQKFDKKSNNDQPDATYYRYQKMAEFIATEDGSYNFSMEMRRDTGSIWAFKSILTKNDGVVESTLSQTDVPNVIAEWQERSMSDSASTISPTSYKVHTVSAKDIKAGDVIRVWMSPSYNGGTKPTNTLDTTKAHYLKNFVVNKIYSQGKNFLTVNGIEAGTAIGNLKGITGSQRLTIGLGQNFFNGVVHEVLVYDRALTKQERETVEAYLYKRWTGNIIPASNHSWNLKIGTSSEGIYPALPSEGGYTANAIVNTTYGYPYFTINENPNISLATEEQPYAARILGSQYGDFLGGGTGSAGYWAEWAEGSTANRQNWARSLTAAGSRHALLNYSTSSEFRKITAEAFLDRKVGLQFDCKNEVIIQPLIPQVKLTYCADFVNSTVYSNGTIIFNYSILNAPNMEYWITDQMEVEVSDGRKLYRYRPEAMKWKSGTNYGQFKISGFVSEGINGKAYTVTFRMLNYYGKVISGSEISIAFTHIYASLPSATNSLTNCANVLGFIGSTEDQTTPSYRFGITLATGVPGEGDLPDGLDPIVWQQYWKDRTEERDLWFWRIGEGDTLPFDLGDCDQLGLRTFWKPGSQPFALKKDDPFYPIFPVPPEGPNYRIPSDIPPKELEPKYVNDENGQEIYWWNNHWWVRSIGEDGTIEWHFRIPTNEPNTTDDPNRLFAAPIGWQQFIPCYGSPLCIGNPGDGRWSIFPLWFQSPLTGETWIDPFRYPPGYFEFKLEDGGYKPVSDPYSTPNDNPSAPFTKTNGWRKTNVPAGRDADGDPYYGRGWDPVIGPYYVDPDGGIRPSVLDSDGNPIAITIRDLEHPPCKNGGRNPGIELPKPSTAQGLDDSVPGL